MTVADLISKLQSFDLDKEVNIKLMFMNINVTDDYRGRLFELDDDDIYFDQREDVVVIDGTFL